MSDPHGTSLSPGDVVGSGRFAITRVLGSGAQATTFEAVDKKDGRLIALKQFSIPRAETWKDVELAEREAEVLAALTHPLVPRYVTHFEEGGSLFLAMEKVEGETLAELRAKSGLDQAEVVRFLRDASEVLDYLHGRAPPIIHRDIKPSNVIRQPDGRFALVDFGSVRHRLRPEGGSTVVGTFGYMAPEQFQGRAMPATDTYAAAATALAVLTGEEPERLPHKGLGIDVPKALDGRFDPALVGLLSEALEPDPDRRSQTPLSALLQKHGLSKGHSAGPASRSRIGAEPSTPPASRASRREERQARRAERREARRVQRVDFTHNPFATREGEAWLRIPFVLVMMLLGLRVARIVLGVVLLLFVPMLLTLLSVVFGPGLRRGARACRNAGHRTRAILRSLAFQARDVARHGASAQERVRVPDERPRVVDVEGRELDAEEEDWEAALEEELERDVERHIPRRTRG